MRSRSPRPCAPPSALCSLARLIDDSARDHPGHLLIHVVEDDDDLMLGARALPTGTHPFSELAGFTAPPDWAVMGVRVRGIAHRLDDDPDHRRAPQPSCTTYLAHRCGEESSVLRNGDTVTNLSGRAAGTLPDLCRRVLGLPTDPPPPSTTALWTVAWLDHLVECWSEPTRRRRLTTSWPEVAALHPAVAARGPALADRLEPHQLITLASAHAAAWPWSRLRSQPDALPLPDSALPTRITEWMDDGFYARWAIGAFPPVGELARDLVPLLDPAVAAALLLALDGLAA